MRSIIIEEIKTREINDGVMSFDLDIVEHNQKVALGVRGKPSIATKYEVDTISPIRFRTEKGEICVGWSSSVEEVLGIPMDVYETQRRDIEELSWKLKNSIEALATIKEASLTTKIKWLFFGVK